MIVDDRLETVLRTVAAGPGAVATQLRQLLDLLGRTPPERWTKAHTGALTRIDSLIAMLGEQRGASLIASAGLRSPILVEHFAEAGPKVALAAITSARLGERDWLAIIPDLPVQARGFLRHRRDLGPQVEALLAQLGITDFALPLPSGPLPAGPVPAEFETVTFAQAEITVLPQPVPAAPAEPTSDTPVSAPSAEDLAPVGDGIGAIIARIEAFRRAREVPAGDGVAASSQTRLPFADEPAPAPPAIIAADLTLDAHGTVIAADAALAPAVIGLRPFAADPDAPVTCDPATISAARARLPITGGRLELEGPASAAGSWRIDAAPSFVPETGHFTGWHARLRRPPAQASAAMATPAANDDHHTQSADRLRQMLHELRTPINAIQGFSELIQQQMLGPTPHQYRSLAAGIASDAAHMLAGFEDIERLAILESAHAPHAAADAHGETDLTALLTRLFEQLELLLAPREVALTHDLPEGPLPIAMAPEYLERTLWRLLSLVASAATPGEELAFTTRIGAGPRGYGVRLTLPLPLAVAQAAGEAAPSLTDRIATPGSMLGNSFALRLSAAELRVAGGHFHLEGTSHAVTLPLLTAARQPPSQRGVAGGQAG